MTHPHGQTEPAVPWYQRIEWLGAVWLVLLVLPTVSLWGATDRPVALRAAGLLGLLGFAVADVWATSTLPPWQQLPVDTTVLQQLRPVAGRLALLVLLSLPSAPVLGWYQVFFLPYLVALLLFGTPVRTGVSLTVVACALAVGATALGAPRDYLWMALGCTGSCAAIAVGRIAAEISERRLVREAERLAATQRTEISRDVHDLLGHTLTVLTLKAEVAQRLVRRDPQQAEAELGQIIELSRSALADIRATVSRLRTPDLVSQIEASRTAFLAAGVEVTVRGKVAAVPARQRPLLAWVLREATTNIIRHAQAQHVQVVLAPGLLQVVDDGVGLPTLAGQAQGCGLRGLRERVQNSGGELRLSSPAPGAQGPGTCLEVHL